MADHELRVGIIGVGLMGADHARRVALRLANARLVAVSDPGHRPGAASRGTVRRSASDRGRLDLVAVDDRRADRPRSGWVRSGSAASCAPIRLDVARGSAAGTRPTGGPGSPSPT